MAGDEPPVVLPASFRELVPWLAELARTLPGLATAYAPGADLDPRTRQQVLLTVSEVNGSPTCTWVHEAWAAFLGEGQPVEGERELLAWARACAEAGGPVDPGPLADALSPSALRSLRATVAQAELAAAADRSGRRLAERLTRRRRAQPWTALWEAATVAAAAPVALPALVGAAAMRLVTRAAPPLPTVGGPPAEQANLLVHLLASAAPAYLGHAVVRLLLLGLPVSVGVGLRSGRSAATVTVGRGTVAVRNGITSDAVVVVEGELEPLLQLASGAIARELRSIRIRPNP